MCTKPPSEDDEDDDDVGEAILGLAVWLFPNPSRRATLPTYVEGRRGPKECHVQQHSILHSG